MQLERGEVQAQLSAENIKMMNIILGSLQTAQIQRFRGSFGYLGAIIPVQAHVDSSSLFPCLGAAGSYSKKAVKTLNTHSKTHRERQHSPLALKAFLSHHSALPGCFPPWISILKGKDICLERLKIDKDTKAIYPFFIPRLTLNNCCASLLLSQSNICVVGNSKFTNKMFGNYASIFFIIMA